MKTRDSLTMILTGLVLAGLLSHGGCGSTGGSGNGNDGGGGGGGGGGGSPTLAAAFTVFKTALTAAVDAGEVESSADLGSIQVRWDWTDDGTWDTAWTTVKTAEHTYGDEGTYTIRLEARTPEGITDTAVKQFMITRVNAKPTAAFAVNVVSGMTASVDASSSADVEDATEDLSVRWDWEGDDVWDTEWMPEKTAQHTYATSNTYTIRLEVMDLNGDTDEASEEAEVSPIAIRSSFFSGLTPYVVRVNFRLINKLTDEPITPSSDPPLERRHFTIFEDDEPIDISETNQILTVGTKPLLLVLVLDYTGSMFDQGGIDDMVAAAKLFIDSQSDNTFLSLWGFWERQGGFGEINDYIQCTATGKVLLKDNLDAFTSAPRDHGATVIWDTLKAVLSQKFLPVVDIGFSRAITFLSDGHDTSSSTSIAKVINVATREKAVAIFPIGLAFRTDQYPADEPNLKRLAEETSGTYFTVNQLSDLSEIFDQMAEDLQSDLILSYVSLQSGGNHVVRVDCDYLDGFASMSTSIPMNELAGDNRQGLLFVSQGPADDGRTEYVISADYMPRNIDTLRIRIAQTDAPATLSLYESDALLLKSEGWTISPDVEAGDSPPADGWYTLSSDSVLEFGAFGRIARCSVEAGNRPTVLLELPELSEQLDLYGDKRIAFAKNGHVQLEVPTYATGIDATALCGTPADRSLPSANARQSISVTGRGLGIGDYLVLFTIDETGCKEAGFVSVESVGADGRTAQFVLPRDVTTDEVFLVDDYSRARFVLQIVPCITGFRDPFGPFSGTGFVEGGMTAFVGSEEYLDTGPGDDDGIDVRGENTNFVLTAPFDPTGPVHVETEGGSSNVFQP